RAQRQEGTEGNCRPPRGAPRERNQRARPEPPHDAASTASAAADGDERDAGERPRERRDDEHGGHRLPAEEGADHREQLHVAVPHASTPVERSYPHATAHKRPPPTSTPRSASTGPTRPGR